MAEETSVAVATAAPPATPPPPVARATSPEPPPPQGSIVNNLARRFVVPTALALDVAATVIRLADTTVQITLPEVYRGWQAHSNGVTAFFYYTAAFTVIAAIAIGTTAALFMISPVMYQIDKRIEVATHIKTKKVKAERLKMLREKKQRYRGYQRLAFAIPILFGVSYFIGSLVGGDNLIVKFITAAADIAAPLMILVVITQTEREYDDIDAQERTMHASTDIVTEMVRRVASSFNGETMTSQQAQVIHRGLDGDVDGMVDAAVPLEPSKRMYTISDLCKKLGADTDRDDPNRKRIYRIVTGAHDDGHLDITKDRKRGWLVPGSLFDELFADFELAAQSIRLVSDRNWTPQPDQPTDTAG